MRLLKIFEPLFKKSNAPFKVTSISHPDLQVPLGQVCTFKINNVNLKQLELKTYIAYQNICFFKQLSCYDEQNTIIFFPEAPGKYILSIEWSNKNKKGWITLPFEVVIEEEYEPFPTIATISPDVKLWTPSTWEASLLQHHETDVLNYIKTLIQPGWVVYDIGANLGLFSVTFAKLVTDLGRVYCIEANPLCVYFLRANLFMNQVSNASIYPIALSTNSNPVEFTINYGNSNLGITKISESFQSKIGQSIDVRAMSLDDLVGTFNLLLPDMIKIDIEGAEEYVIPAMENTLKKCHPVLLMELHGEKAGVNTLRFLEQFGYRYINIGTQECFASARELISVFKDEVLQVVALPK